MKLTDDQLDILAYVFKSNMTAYYSKSLEAFTSWIRLGLKISASYERMKEAFNKK